MNCDAKYIVISGNIEI